jgi:hypothetical protein
MLRQAFLLVVLSISAYAQGARHFNFHYGFTVKDIPSGQKVRIWIPAAHSDDFQEVKVVSATGDLSLKKNREPKYGNEMYYAETGKAAKAELHFEVVYDVVRHERVVLGRAIPRLSDFTLDKKTVKRDTAPDALVPVTGVPAELAAKVVADKKTPLEKARAIYDYVIENMTYDKTETGSGHGDALYASNVKKGDCTDFHSLFIAMARSQGIPARFETGFSLPADKTSGEIADYHCWADFFEPEHGWVPVDISEGWKQEVKRDYFFGAYDDNRIEFSMGRDLKLNPAQDGQALNYFVYPYVEVDGKKYENVSMVVTFTDVSENASTQK